jgi:glucose-1-phosphate thymidylyltransferase
VVFCPKSLLEAVVKNIADGSIVDDSVMMDRYLYTEVLDRGFVEIRMDSWEAVLSVSGFVKIVEQACGMNLYCLEEIAWRRGLITTEQLGELARKKDNKDHGNYLLRLSGQEN